ncbi:malonyl- -acyl carrier mitochondrial [Brachionus plicatilis]|uniref:[acyl-carrier-protein] S-malonyltransferase n=1 Tax=Brachionus plicatilis TaxID=10195 RepID=A0A3M7R3Y6_BRAPC|nr:malonyl- -acyl carrier mitochondrial [Brachionus plicatilis]
MPSIIIFPGQGSQFIGMGKKLLDVPKVSRMFEIASNVFKFDLLSLCLNGPKNDLDKTRICQPAIFVTSLAAVEYLKHTQPDIVKECYATAGFSIGEYASLVLSGAVTYEDALKLIKVRSEAMQEASQAVSSGLMSVFVNRDSKLNSGMLAARKWCREKLKIEEPIECQIANYLFSKCKVIGGNTEALDFLELNKKEFGINKVKRLAVSGAFHTKLMKSAEEKFNKEIDKIVIKTPVIKFYSNYDANLCMNPKKIRFNLVRQIANPVKWEQILNTLYYDENLPTSDNEKTENLIYLDRLGNQLNSEKKFQSKERLYPNIYECGPVAQTGPILKAINFKAFSFYKHIDV